MAREHELTIPTTLFKRINEGNRASLQCHYYEIFHEVYFHHTYYLHYHYTVHILKLHQSQTILTG